MRVAATFRLRFIEAGFILNLPCPPSLLGGMVQRHARPLQLPLCKGGLRGILRRGVSSRIVVVELARQLIKYCVPGIPRIP